MLATIGFESGKHFWSVKLDEYGHENDIFIGVCRRDANNKPLNLAGHVLESNAAWGWVCTNGAKRWPGNLGSNGQAYGDYSKIGEELGVLLEFKLDAVHLTFLRNGVSLGVCFDNIPAGETYYPCVSMFNNEATETQVTLNPNAKMPVLA